MDWVGEEERFSSWLSETEAARVKRLRSRELRQRFTISHGLVRKILGCYLRQPAEKIELDVSPFGKPFLAGASSARSPRLRFNYSHSAGLLILAASEEYDLGIDIEEINPEIGHAEIASHFFDQDEKSWLQTLGPEDQVKAFYFLWTCKEAVLKADSSGLRQSLDGIKIEFKPEEEKWLGWLAGGKMKKAPWTLQPFSPESGYAAALAYSLEAGAKVRPEIRFLQLVG